MKGRDVVLGELAGRPFAALMVDGRLDDILFDTDALHPPGEVCRGKVYRIVKGGAFIQLPNGQGFLRGGGRQKTGQAVLVQVTGFADGAKAIPVTERLVFKGRTAIVTPGAEGMNLSRQIKNEDDRLRLFSAIDTFKAATSPHGIVARTAAVQAETQEIEAEVDSLLDQADAVLADWKGDPAVLVPAPTSHEIARRDWVQGDDRVAWNAEDTSLLDQIEELRRAEAALPQGSMIIEATRALVAVDVNTGGDFSPAAGLKTNIAAARELPRQLRLRGLGGQVVVDFAPMPKKDRRTLEQTLKAAFRKDTVETSLVGWTGLGLYELQRKRERRPLAEVLGNAEF